MIHECSISRKALEQTLTEGNCITVLRLCCKTTVLQIDKEQKFLELKSICIIKQVKNSPIISHFISSPFIDCHFSFSYLQDKINYLKLLVSVSYLFSEGY